MITLKENLPKLLRNTFWEDFMDAIQTELTNVETEIAAKQNIFNTRTNLDPDNLTEIAKTLGYTPDLSLNASTDNLTQNVLSIQFRIKNKTTRVSYDYIFKTVPNDGQLFIMYWATSKLLRAADAISTIETNLTAANPSLPFLFTAVENFSEFLYTQLYLDTGLQLDSTSVPWHLDTLYSTLKTNHVAVEYNLEKLVQDSLGTNYLMLPPYLDYLATAVNYTRKVTEVPHVGCNLSLIMDPSQYFDAYSHGEAYSMPTIQVKSAVTNNYVPTNSAAAVVKLVVGTGTQTLPAYGAVSPTWPTALANQCTSDVVITDQTNETTNYKYIFGYIPMNSVTDEAVSTGTGAIMTVSGTTKYPGVKPYSVNIFFTSSPATYTIIDDGKGNLLVQGQQTNPMGSIDYSTGVYTFTTQIVNSVPKEVLGNASLTTLDTFIAHHPIKPGTCKFYFTLTGGNSFIVTDDGSGNMLGTGLTTGTINYTTGELNVTFSSATATGVDIYVVYDYTVPFTVDLSSPLTMNYAVTQNLNITEAGLIDTHGNLIAYATFPPIQGGSTNYHIGFQFFIKKSAF